MGIKSTVVTAVALILSGNANASLIGDTVTMQHVFPDIDTLYKSPTSTIVESGAADVLCPHTPGISRCDYYSVNMEADTVLINHEMPGWTTTVSFNGVFIDSLDDSSGNVLSGVTVDTNISNWDSSMLLFDGNSIWVNFLTPSSDELGQGLITLTLDFSVSEVPVPASVWLFGTGLIGLIGIARRKKA